LCLSLRSAITIKSPYVKSPQDNTAGRRLWGRQNFPGRAGAWSRMRDRTRRQPTTYAAFMAINADAERNLQTCFRGFPQFGGCMRFFSKGAAVGIGCLALALVLLAPSLTHGDEWNLATRFTVNHQSEVPGMVLQANTPYVIRLVDSPSDRNVVQIYDKDQKHMLTMFMAISAERLEPADKTVFKFIETAPGYPLPIKEWFYPGRLNGLEFVYPKDQAQSIAGHAREPVLAADTSDLHHLHSITVEAISPTAQEPPVTESAANITKSEST